MATKQQQTTVELKAPNLRTIQVPIVGVTELIMNKWSEKAKKMMLDKQMGKPVKKTPKDPEEDYQSTIYYDDDGNYAFPAGGFKTAMVDACRLIDNIAMVFARQVFHVDGEWVRIYGEPRMREDMVRIGPGTADIRYRAGFKDWSAVLSITFLADQITSESILNIVNLAGLGGVGDWRPSAPKSKSGTFGRFEVDVSKFNQLNKE